MSSSIIKAKLPCPFEGCNSSDGYYIYDDGHGHCYSCDTTGSASTEGRMSMEKRTSPTVQPLTNNRGTYTEIKDRRITRETCKYYGVACTNVSNVENTFKIGQIIFPYYDKDNNYIATKSKKDHDYTWAGEGRKATLFGQNLFKGGGKYVTLTEGEMDALSAYQMLGSKWPVLSVTNGAQSAKRSCQKNFEFLDSFEHIVICFDNDDPGQKAAKEVAELFEPNKCRIVPKEHKDASEYLQKGQGEKYSQAWWNAKVFTPAGIINLKDLGDELYEEKDNLSVLYPWNGLNDKTFGIRTGEIVTWTGGTGTGKSSFVREIVFHILNERKENIGVLCLEESVKNTVFHLMSIAAEDRLHIREIREKHSREDLKRWQEETVGTGRIFAFDHFGSLDTDEILARVRYMVKALDCKWLFLDHLSILVSGLEGVDERRNIDVLMTKLRSLVEETDCSLSNVCHLRRTSGDDGHEDGKEVKLAHLRGSQSIAQLSDIVIGAERDQQADTVEEANTVTVRVLKNRYSGYTGIACKIRFDPETGRLSELIPEKEEDDPFVVKEDDFNLASLPTQVPVTMTLIEDDDEEERDIIPT